MPKASPLHPLQQTRRRPFLANETRYSSLTRKFPDRAKDLFAKSEAAAHARFDHLQKLVELYT